MLLGPAISLFLGNPSIHTCTQYPNSAKLLQLIRFLNSIMQATARIAETQCHQHYWQFEYWMVVLVMYRRCKLFNPCCIFLCFVVCRWAGQSLFGTLSWDHSFVQHRWGHFLLSISLSLCLWFLSRYSRFSFLNPRSFLLHLFSVLKPNTVYKVQVSLCPIMNCSSFAYQGARFYLTS